MTGTIPQPGLSFRGGFGDVDRSRYAVGTTLQHHGTLHTSRDLRIATDNFTDRDIVAVLGRQAYDVSADSEYPDELETVFPSDPELTVVAQVQLDDRYDTRLGDSFGDRAAARGDTRPDERLADHPWVTVLVVRSDDGDRPTDVDDAVQRVAHAIAGARTLPPADLTRPGRYRGPIGD